MSTSATRLNDAINRVLACIASSGPVQASTARSTSYDSGTAPAASGKADRVVFKLNVELEKLEARLQYESSTAPPLALVTVEEVAVDLTVHPDTLKATASLGNLRAQDGILPEVSTALMLGLHLLCLSKLT